MRSIRNSGNRGFTLIEILVVIVIIAILAALAAAIYPRVKEGAMKANCLSNERQLGVAFLAYAGDHDGVLPPSWHTPVDVEGQHGWDTAIMPYVKNKELFHCPADYTGGTRSYSINDQPARLGDLGDGTILANVPRSAHYVMLSEWHSDGNNLGSGGCCSMWDPNDETQQAHYKTSPEAMGVCYLFYDGHAEFFTYPRMATLQHFYFDPRP